MIIAYDLETCIMQRGYKRPQGLILEIGAYDIFLDRSFRCFVNPTEQKLTKENYLSVLEAEGARPYPTRTHAENIRYEPESALPLRVAMQQFLSFIQTAEVLCAHNGRSFDDKIVQGSLERCGLQWPSEMRFLDSYYDVSKKVWPGRRSYKLQVLHRALCPEASSLKWHTALDDSMGLAHLLGAAARHTVAENVELAAQYVEKDYGVYGELGQTDIVWLEMEGVKGEDMTVSLQRSEKRAVYDVAIWGKGLDNVTCGNKNWYGWAHSVGGHYFTRNLTELPAAVLEAIGSSEAFVLHGDGVESPVRVLRRRSLLAAWRLQGYVPRNGNL